MVFNIDVHHMIEPPLVREIMAATCAGAQTERRGGAV
jgi:hypothetical protein